MCTRARRCDLWSRQCDKLYSVATKFSHLVANLAPQDRWRSSLGKRTLMIICYPLQNQRRANGFANALTFCPNALTVCLKVLTICLNALMISSNTVTDCSHDLTVGPSNVDFYLKDDCENHKWWIRQKSYRLSGRSVAVLNRPSQQVVRCFFREWLLTHRFKTIS